MALQIAEWVAHDVDGELSLSLLMTPKIQGDEASGYRVIHLYSLMVRDSHHHDATGSRYSHIDLDANFVEDCLAKSKNPLHAYFKEPNLREGALKHAPRLASKLERQEFSSIPVSGKPTSFKHRI